MLPIEFQQNCVIEGPLLSRTVRGDPPIGDHAWIRMPCLSCRAWTSFCSGLGATARTASAPRPVRSSPNAASAAG